MPPSSENEEDQQLERKRVLSRESSKRHRQRKRLVLDHLRNEKQRLRGEVDASKREKDQLKQSIGALKKLNQTSALNRETRGARLRETVAALKGLSQGALQPLLSELPSGQRQTVLKLIGKLPPEQHSIPALPTAARLGPGSAVMNPGSHVQVPSVARMPGASASIDLTGDGNHVPQISPAVAAAAAPSSFLQWAMNQSLHRPSQQVSSSLARLPAASGSFIRSTLPNPAFLGQLQQPPLSSKTASLGQVWEQLKQEQRLQQLRDLRALSQQSTHHGSITGIARAVSAHQQQRLNSAAAPLVPNSALPRREVFDNVATNRLLVQEWLRQNNGTQHAAPVQTVNQMISNNINSNNINSNNSR